MTEPLYPAPLDLDQAWSADTVAVQAGRPARVAGAPMNPPIIMSSTYVHDASVEYGRDGNETWGALEAALDALDGGSAVTFASGLARLRLVTHATSLGGVESLIERRARYAGDASIVGPTLCRLSVGIENVEDLWADLDVAMRAVLG
jgi:cystathionine gamma-synthase